MTRTHAAAGELQPWPAWLERWVTNHLPFVFATSGVALLVLASANPATPSEPGASTTAVTRMVVLGCCAVLAGAFALRALASYWNFTRREISASRGRGPGGVGEADFYLGPWVAARRRRQIGLVNAYAFGLAAVTSLLFLGRLDAVTGIFMVVSTAGVAALAGAVGLLRSGQLARPVEHELEVAAAAVPLGRVPAAAVLRIEAPGLFARVGVARGSAEEEVATRLVTDGSVPVDLGFLELVDLAQALAADERRPAD